MTLFANFPSYLRSIDNHICKSIKVEHSSHYHDGKARVYHVVCCVPVPLHDMSRIDAEIIKEGYAVYPTEPKESACQYHNHRQYVDHKVDEDIARHIFIIWNKHLSVVVGEIYHSVGV